MNYQQKCHDIFYASDVAKKLPVALPLPVRADGYGCYIWGPESEMVADSVRDYTGGEYKADELGEPIRIRGWGRIQYIQHPDKTPQQLQDEIIEWVAEAMNSYAEPQLQDWLAMIDRTKPGNSHIFQHGSLIYRPENKILVDFNLTTGQPATEADWKALYELIA